MNLKSGKVSQSKNSMKFGFEVVSLLVFILSFSFIMTLSYHGEDYNSILHNLYENENSHFITMVTGIVNLIFININLAKAKLKEIENAVSLIVKHHSILAPIAMFVQIAMVGTLISGKLIGWWWYVATVVCGGFLFAMQHTNKENEK